MIKRIFLGGLLTALTFVAVPINSASADHATDPCNDPSVQPVGTAQTGSLSGSSDYDVWFDDGSRPLADVSLPFAATQYGWVVNADGPIRVETWHETSSGACVENSNLECVETAAPYTCHRNSFGETEQYIVIEHGKQLGFGGQREYQLVYGGNGSL